MIWGVPWWTWLFLGHVVKPLPPEMVISVPIWKVLVIAIFQTSQAVLLVLVLFTLSRKDHQ